jgi:hypothetical protein
VWNLHEQRGRKAELIELHPRYFERAYCAQIRSSKQLLHSCIAQMYPGVQWAFLQARLETPMEKARQIRTPVSDE